MTAPAGNNPLTAFRSSSNQVAELEKRRSRVGLHQGIARTLIKAIHTEQGLVALAGRLTSIADHAYLHRRYDVVGEVARLLLDLPLPDRFESVGRYYEALWINRNSRGDAVRGGSLFERVADDAPLRYRARALLALGTNSLDALDSRIAMSFYRDASRLVTLDGVFDPMTLYFVSRMTATIKGFDGDNRGALADLEKMFGLVRTASSLQPFAYYDYMNALAVELSDVGRLEQARRASEMSLASPYASAFPEWRETFDEIARKQTKRQSGSRSLIGVPQMFPEVDVAQHRRVATRKLVHLPAREPIANTVSEPCRPEHALARILSFPLRKGAADEQTKPVSLELAREQRRRMTTAEKLIRLMDLISHDETDDETIDRILEAVEEIVMSRRSRRLD